MKKFLLLLGIVNATLAFAGNNSPSKTKRYLCAENQVQLSFNAESFASYNNSWGGNGAESKDGQSCLYAMADDGNDQFKKNTSVGDWVNANFKNLGFNFIDSSNVTSTDTASPNKIVNYQNFSMIGDLTITTNSNKYTCSNVIISQATPGTVGRYWYVYTNISASEFTTPNTISCTASQGYSVLFKLTPIAYNSNKITFTLQ